ncbi:hypothetical protein IWX47DRAFT_863948 [Phyllosticta citricarpa]
MALLLYLALAMALRQDEWAFFFQLPMTHLVPFCNFHLQGLVGSVHTAFRDTKRRSLFIFSGISRPICPSFPPNHTRFVIDPGHLRFRINFPWALEVGSAVCDFSSLHLSALLIFLIPCISYRYCCSRVRTKRCATNTASGHRRGRQAAG